MKKLITLIVALTITTGCSSRNITVPVTPSPVNTPTTENFIISSVKNIFSEYDLNKNGNIEPKELKFAPNSFKEMDKNNDGVLSFDEVKPSYERVNQISTVIKNFYRDLYKELDTNKDNKLSKAEFYSNEMLEPIIGSASWNTSVSKVSTLSTSGSINNNEFEYLMNDMFTGFTSDAEIRSAGLWSWLKDKFAKKEPPSSVGKKPVILVQGYAEPSWYFMYGIYRNLKKSGWKVYPVNLFPNINDIREQAQVVAAKIEEIKKAENTHKIDYVAHSMGGLIGRYYMQKMNGAGSINNYVSIATPHYGTYMAYVGIGEAAKQMRPGSPFLNELNAGNPILPTIKYTSIWTKTDEIVIPSKHSKLNGSTIMDDVKFVGHLLILWAPKTYRQIQESLNK